MAEILVVDDEAAIADLVEVCLKNCLLYTSDDADE